jgi:class 3 adenylate cyclase
MDRLLCARCRHRNPADARFCNQCAQPLPTQKEGRAPGEAFDVQTAIEGERKLVSVLFADVKGSTELIAQVDAEIARQLLDPILQHMMEAVRHYGGTVNQLTGDGVMALFGAPSAQEDHAVRACAAGLRIQDNLARHYAAQQGAAIPRPRARVESTRARWWFDRSVPISTLSTRPSA